MNGSFCFLREDWEERRFKDSFRRMGWPGFVLSLPPCVLSQRRRKEGQGLRFDGLYRVCGNLVIIERRGLLDAWIGLKRRE